MLPSPSLDHPHLPQRVVAVQRQCRDMPADLGQFTAAARRGHGDAVQVAPQLEVFVVDPHRMVGVELAVGEFHPELRDSPDVLGEQGP